MARTEAIQFVEGLLQRVDEHTRAVLDTAEGGVEVDSINVIIGDGATAVVDGVAAAIRVDFRARLTGAFLQEFDGTTGSVTITVAKAPGGLAPTWATLGSAAITSGRYFADESLSTWSDTYLARGDYLRFSVSGMTDIMRVHVTLRIRRLEP